MFSELQTQLSLSKLAGRVKTSTIWLSVALKGDLCDLSS